MKEFMGLKIAGYRQDIDGLRALAIIPVVLFHAFPKVVQGGFIGVDIFFVISGYLISRHIMRDIYGGRFSFADFYCKRIRRIFPSLIIVILVALAFAWFALFPGEYRTLGYHAFGGATFLSNFILWKEVNYFDGAAEFKPFLHLWSLAIEEQFYLLWPVILLFAFGSRLKLLPLILGVILVSFGLNIIVGARDPLAAFYMPFSRFWELLIGSFIAWTSLETSKTSKLVSVAQNLATSAKTIFGYRFSVKDLASLVAFAIILGCLTIYDRLTPYPGWRAALPAVSAAAIIACGPMALINRTILAHRLAVFFGLISYSLYLWHWPLLSFGQIIESSMLTDGTKMALVLLAVVLSLVSTRFVEIPIRSSKVTARQAIQLAGAMAAVGCLGLAILGFNGVPTRTALKGYTDNGFQLERPALEDEACLAFTKGPISSYCRYADVKGKETVALIGDSHAYTAFTGIAEYFNARQTNVLMLSSGGCPPFVGVALHGITETEMDDCRQKTRTTLSFIADHPEITRVLIFSRGDVYLTEAGPEKGEQYSPDGKLISPDAFRAALQALADRLRRPGREVAYILNNPELALYPNSCLARPFNYRVADCRINRQEVLAAQGAYRRAVAGVTGITLIDPMDAFCATDKCKVFDEGGKLLYIDRNHISKMGSRFLMTSVIAPALGLPAKP